MKSYFLGIVVAIALSVIYVTYNTAEITINYLGFQASVNQGLWDVFLFSIGAIIMWVLSIGASFESYSANKKRARELNQKIEDLENEKKSLLAALQNIGKPKHTVQTHEISPEKTTKEDTAPEETKPDEKSPSPIKSFFSSVFKSGKKPEPEETHFDKAETFDQTEAVDEAETCDHAEMCDQADVCCDQAEICDQTEAVDQVEAFDQIGVCEQTEDAELVAHVEIYNQTEVYDQAEADYKIEIDGDKVEEDENAGEDEQDDYAPYGNVCEPDLDLDDDEAPEDGSDSMEKEEREIFTV